MTTNERVSQDMTSKVHSQNERISTWLKVEMTIAGSKDLPIHIDADIEDDDDPFEPQRKQFLLMEEKRILIAKELDQRRQVFKIRKIRREERRSNRRKGEEERRARQKWKSFLADLPTEPILEVIRHTHRLDLQKFLRGGKGVRDALKKAGRKWELSLPRLPAELILEVIRHTRLDDLQNLLKSGKAIHRVYCDNEAAVPPGVEAAQFSGFRRLFGSGRRRSGEQKQALKDYIGTHLLLNDPRRIPKTFDKIDQGKFADWSAIGCLQNVDDNITEDVRYHKSIGMELERQSALCLRMFSSWEQRVEETESNQSPDKDDILDDACNVTLVKAMPTEARLRLFERQAADIQANIRDVLETKIVRVVEMLDDWPLAQGESGDHPLMGQETKEWIVRYYSAQKVGPKMKQNSMGLWIAKLAAGYILEVLLPAEPWLGPDLLNIAENVRFDNGFFKDVLAQEFMISGSTDKLWKDSREFAGQIGLNFGRMLEGTAVGKYLER